MGRRAGRRRARCSPIAALAGLTLYSQWFVFDPLGPSGFATSRGGEVRLF